MTPNDVVALCVALLATVALLAPTSRAALTRRDP